jgi:hypothetical protein
MKLHPDPTPEFAELAKTWYQRYVLYRLESSAVASPWRYIGVWILLVIPVHLRSTASEIVENGWYTAAMTFLSVLAIGEIYFSRAVLNMLRDRHSIENKTDQQAVVGNRDNAANSLRSGPPIPRLPAL